MIFLDSAATTLQKPASVHEAVRKAMRTAASPGRGGYPPAVKGAELVFQCRERAAGLFGAESPEQVVLTFNATHSLNIAIRSLAKPGGRCVISGYEHNAVTRTLNSLPALQTDVAHGRLFHPEELLEHFKKLLPGADFAVCCHVSNVFGYILPVEEVAALCKKEGVPLIVDASQSAGVLPLNMKKLHAAFIAMPGHKCLYGPQGTGLLLCSHGVQTLPLLTGGTGSSSLEQKMPDFLPDRLEAGTHNVPGAAGLVAGMEFVQKKTPAVIRRHEQRLRALLAKELAKLPDVTVYESTEPAFQTGVLSFVSKRTEPEELAQRLGERGICVRAGYHCAPLAHQSGGTIETGTVRVSFSAFNNENHVEALVRALRGKSGKAS